LDRLSNILKDRLAAQQAANGGHPEADTLLAFVEGELSVPARERVLAHLSTCPDCRQAVTLATPELEQAAGQPFAFSRFGIKFPAAMRWTSAAAALAVAVGVGVLSYEHSSQPAPPEATTSKQEVASAPSPVTSNQIEKTAPAAQKPLRLKSNSDRASLASQSKQHGKDAGIESRRIDANGGVAGALLGGLQPNLTASKSKSQDEQRVRAGEMLDKSTQSPKLAAPRENQYTYGAFNGAPAQSQAPVAKADVSAPNAPGANIYGGAVRSNIISEIADAAPVKTVASSAIGGSLKKRGVSASTPIVHWTISSAGILQRQSANRTMVSVQPAPGVIVSTVAAQGIEVWTAGMQSEISSSRPGLLFHSSDAGENWSQIKGPWQGPIKGLVLSQSSVLSVIADDGTWSTTDAGKSWAKR